MTGHLVPGDDGWTEDKALLADWSHLNTEIARFIMRQLDVDARRAEPIPTEDEHTFGQRLIELGTPSPATSSPAPGPAGSAGHRREPEAAGVEAGSGSSLVSSRRMLGGRGCRRGVDLGFRWSDLVPGGEVPAEPAGVGLRFRRPGLSDVYPAVRATGRHRLLGRCCLGPDLAAARLVASRATARPALPPPDRRSPCNALPKLIQPGGGWTLPGSYVEEFA